jgi:poly-beta-1,6-N-acetyl-D-glucosamine synthase
MTTLFEQIVLWTFVAATAVQIFFWLFFFGRLAIYKEKETGKNDPGSSPLTSHSSSLTSHSSPLPSVSVIICARNEEANLRNHLYRILNQTYRSYEVLVVNHKSSDNSLHVLSSLQRKFKHLRIVNCDDEKAGKKVALAKGIEQAKNQVLLMTDADCVPASNDWIRGMVSGMEENTQIVLGVAPFFEAPGPLNKFVRFEACYTAMQYLSFTLAGLPYMGVGRNLAYRRELFERSGGFRQHEHLASGDDDLFVNEVAKKGHVGIRLNPATFMYSPPKLSLRDYFQQKTRHFSTGKYYKLRDKIFLSSLTMSHLLHYLLGGVLLTLKISIIFALLGYAVRMGVVMIISSVILNKFQHRSLRLWIPVLDAVLVIFYLVFAPATLMNNDTQRWN